MVATKPEPSAPWHQTVEPVDQHAHSGDQWLEQNGHQNLNARTPEHCGGKSNTRKSSRLISMHTVETSGLSRMDTRT